VSVSVCVCVRVADGRLVWYGVALGALVGVMLVVMDEAVAKQPLLQVDQLACCCHGDGDVVVDFGIFSQTVYIEQFAV